MYTELRWIGAKRHWKNYRWNIEIIVDECEISPYMSTDRNIHFTDSWEACVERINFAQCSQVLSVIYFLRGVLEI